MAPADMHTFASDVTEAECDAVNAALQKGSNVEKSLTWKTERQHWTGVIDSRERPVPNHAAGASYKAKDPTTTEDRYAPSISFVDRCL